MDAMTAPAAAAPEPDAEVAARLRLSVMRVARVLRAHSGEEVSASQLSALSTLDRRGPATLGELSVTERVKPPTMTRVVASLEEMGVVTRTPDQRDRRVARVALTDAGRELLARTRSSKDAFLAARLRSLPEADRRELARAADALERLLEAP